MENESELSELIGELEDTKIHLLKHKYDLLNIYYYNLLIFKEADDEDHPSGDVLIRSKVLIDKIDQIIKRVEYDESKGNTSLSKQIMKNEGITFKQANNITPRQKFRKKAKEFANSKPTKSKKPTHFK